MFQRFRLRAVSAILTTLTLIAFPTVAESQEAPAAESTVAAAGDAQPAVTLAEVEAALAATEGDATIGAAVKEKYQRAIDAVNKAAEFESSTARYRQVIDSGSATAAQFREQSQALPSVNDAADVTVTGSVEDLQSDIETRQAALDVLTDELTRTTAELTRVEGRPVEISARLPEAQRELSETVNQLKSPANEGDSTSDKANRILLRATQAMLQSELEMLRQEQSSQSIRGELLLAQQELLARQVENANAALGSLKGLLQQQLTSEAEQFTLTLPRDVPADDAEAIELAAEVQDLAQQYANVLEHLRLVTPAVSQLKSRLQDLTAQYDSVRSELVLGSGGQEMAQILFKLDDQARVIGLRVQVPVTLDQARLASFQVEGKRREQRDKERQFANRSSASVRRLVETRGEVLDKLKTQQARLTRALAELEADRKQLQDKSSEIHSYVKEQLFGFNIRSCPPLQTKSVTDIPAGLKWILQTAHWRALGTAMLHAAQSRPAATAATLLVVALLLATRLPIRSALEQTGIHTRRISTDRYALTLAALGWTLLMAIPIPLLIGFVRWAVAQPPEPSTPAIRDWMHGLANALGNSTWVAAWMAPLAAILCRDGLGTAHFGWNKDNAARFRTAIFGFTVVYIPALLLIGSCAFGDEASQYYGSVARVSFIVAHAWTAVLIWQLFRRSDGILTQLAHEHPSRLIIRCQFLWFPILLACPLGLAVVASFGYLITAMSLSIGLLTTTVIIAGGEVLYCMTLRGFMIKERRLALAEALERRRERQQAAASAEEPEPPGELVAVDPDEEQELDLECISDQTAALLRLLFGLIVAIGIILFWSRGIPLMAVAEGITIPLTGGLSLLAFSSATIIAIVIYFVVQNLPGLLELAVLRGSAMEVGTRNAVCTLCQYAATAVGLMALFNVLQLDWEKFGWMAAALSVGLGFGLQEVVANFVCGLILLFERPIRVGDVVTLEGTTGTVTRMHLRATTITNWDRQDFVVPNKNLITGTILNWTLSAPLNRIVIPVGVAYGTDTEKARQILLDVAAGHPEVLDDPPPIAAFEQFADSSLNLVLRAYLPDLDQRMGTITELHTAIDKRFAAAGIEIPFPQQDLHLRSGWGGRSAGGVDGSGNGNQGGVPAQADEGRR